MGVFDDWMKGMNYTIEDIMNKKLLFTYTEFMTWLTRTKKKKAIISKTSCINTKHNAFSHIWNIISLRNCIEFQYTCNFKPPDQLSKI
ncbi:MAG: hypothetical protein EZS28_036923 [Streblomastix strix]|uniref:Uncharacterized protein n=1 Tax=Streblomastix strix TaxID=222440 RepID=A0A5J4UCB3_9EUKA|nr:MAG: hypothetical protein EZS28_036923 [Streblomastix strix]